MFKPIRFASRPGGFVMLAGVIFGSYSSEAVVVAPTTPASRICIVPADDRSHTAPARTTSYTVPADDRTFTTESD